MVFRFDYDEENDILAISDRSQKISESVEFSEDIILDLDYRGSVVGVEVFYASEFLSAFNKELNKSFLGHLENAYLEFKEFRNMWFIMLVLKSGNKIIRQAMPPLRKSEYVSPLIA